MTTYNTGNSIGSTDSRDRLDNTENMDYLENSTTELTHPDRLGTVRKTRHGMEVEHDAQISAHEVEHDAQMQAFESDFDGRLAGMAFTRVGSFTTGATLTDMRQVLVWEAAQGGDEHEYGWTGAFPKVVAAGATPETSGVIGAGAWVDRTDVTLRDELGEIVKTFNSVADMVADTTLAVGDIVRTIGYYGNWVATASAPLGGNDYEVVSPSIGTVDGGSFISLANGLHAKGLFRDGVNVTQFGAINSKTVDSTSAFTAALNYSGLVYVSPGSYRASINLNTYNSIVGAGSGAATSGKTTIYKGPSDAVTIDATSLNKEFCNVKGINFVDDTADTETVGINFVGSSVSNINDNHYFEDVVIYGFSTGIKVRGRAIYNTFDLVVINAGAKGSMLLDSETDNSDVSFNMNIFSNCKFWGSNLGAIRIVNANVGNKFINCGIESNNKSNTAGVPAFYVSGSRDLVIDGCYFEANGIGVATDTTTLSNNSIDVQIGEYNSSIPGTYNPTIRNCWFAGATISIKIGNADTTLTTPRTIVRGGVISNNLFVPGKESGYTKGWALYAAFTKESPGDSNVIFYESNNIRSGTVLILPDGNNECAVTYSQNKGNFVKTLSASSLATIPPYSENYEINCDSTGVGKTLSFDFLVPGMKFVIRNLSGYSLVFDPKYFLNDTVNFIVNNSIPPKSMREYYCVSAWDSDSRFKLISKSNIVKMISAPPIRAIFKQGDVVNNRAVSAGGYLGYVCTYQGGATEATWASSTAYTAGQWVNIGGTACECLTTGTSGTSQPTTPTAIGNTIPSDGSCSWICRSTTIATLKTYGAISA